MNEVKKAHWAKIILGNCVWEGAEKRGKRTSPDSNSPTVCMGIQLPLLFQAEDVLAVLCEERLEDLISDNFLDTQSVLDWIGPGLASVYSSSS